MIAVPPAEITTWDLNISSSEETRNIRVNVRFTGGFCSSRKPALIGNVVYPHGPFAGRVCTVAERTTSRLRTTLVYSPTSSASRLCWWMPKGRGGSFGVVTISVYISKSGMREEGRSAKLLTHSDPILRAMQCQAFLPLSSPTTNATIQSGLR